MNARLPETAERRLLVFAPVGKDGVLIESVLRADGVGCHRCTDLADLVRELERGAGALMVAEEAFAEHDSRLVEVISRQPPWSDLPVLMLTRQGADSAAVALAVQSLGNVTLIERPVRIGALASAVRSALRARDRQYQTRAHLEERERANQRKDEFLATLAHELRNPLAPIRNALTLLRQGDSDMALACDVMERQVGHMVRLVDDLLEVSRLTRGMIELRREAVDLADVIAAAVETSRPLIDAAGHALTVSLPRDCVMLNADSMRLAQVFSNLLNNAAKYTDRGGHISVSVACSDSYAVVAVADDGIGIPPSALEGIFDMFSQVDARDSRAQSGLGIGLTIVRRLVEMHGGEARAESAGPGQGSRFIVTLPRVRDARPRAMPAPAPAVDGARHRVMVVDDNRDSADTMGAVLRKLGAEVCVVHSGPAALEAFGKFRPGVVFLDIGMPGMDGYEVARRIRERSDAEGAVLVALTGWGQDRDRSRTADAGFHHHLVKPADFAALGAVLSSASTRRPLP
jgi:signal transduction histidine kinase/ActR/RegA family two-component response regulator